MKLSRFSMGIGDRFAHQGRAQLEAFVRANALGVEVAPVWNKSFREHKFIGSEPESVRFEADAAVRALGWKGAYFVDADHIGLQTVDGFLKAADFFTLDVADFIGGPASDLDVKAFLDKYGNLTSPFDVTRSDVEKTVRKYLVAVQEAGKIYRRIESKKGVGNFITEISMDETDQPQTPKDLLVILAAIAAEGIPVRTIAPKFSGRFNKGVDFVGDVELFENEFDQDLSVLSFAIQEFGLPDDLKLSIHSGSDKFSLYGPIARTIHRRGSGLHLKTAGTTWLEELIGLAESGGSGLEVARQVYVTALEHYEELIAPYLTVIDIKPSQLPLPDEVLKWTGEQYSAALTHDEKRAEYNRSFRQFLHVSFKIAAQMGPRFTDALKENEAFIARRVTGNLWERHIRRIFLDQGSGSGQNQQS